MERLSRARGHHHVRVQRFLAVDAVAINVYRHHQRPVGSLLYLDCGCDSIANPDSHSDANPHSDPNADRDHPQPNTNHSVAVTDNCEPNANAHPDANTNPHGNHPAIQP